MIEGLYLHARGGCKIEINVAMFLIILVFIYIYLQILDLIHNINLLNGHYIFIWHIQKLHIVTTLHLLCLT